ncbi:MAG: type II secretion system protein [Sedimentibacter sp.]
MNKKLFKGKKGFTLIELIVVIAILAVLAMLALPTFDGLIDESRDQVGEANARTAYTAAKAVSVIKQIDLEDVTESDIKDYLGSDFSTANISVNASSGAVTVSMDGLTGTYPD